MLIEDGSVAQVGAVERTGAEVIDWSPDDGLATPGRVRRVFARADHVVDDGRFRGGARTGAYDPVARVSRAPESSRQYAIQPPSTRTFAPLM